MLALHPDLFGFPVASLHEGTQTADAIDWAERWRQPMQMLWLAARPWSVTGDGLVLGAGCRVAVGAGCRVAVGVAVGVVSTSEAAARPLPGLVAVRVVVVVVVACEVKSAGLAGTSSRNDAKIW